MEGIYLKFTYSHTKPNKHIKKTCFKMIIGEGKKALVINY